jgi:hypothetical protein
LQGRPHQGHEELDDLGDEKVVGRSQVDDEHPEEVGLGLDQGPKDGEAVGVDGEGLLLGCGGCVRRGLGELAEDAGSGADDVDEGLGREDGDDLRGTQTGAEARAHGPPWL